MDDASTAAIALSILPVRLDGIVTPSHAAPASASSTRQRDDVRGGSVVVVVVVAPGVVVVALPGSVVLVVVVPPSGFRTIGVSLECGRVIDGLTASDVPSIASTFTSSAFGYFAVPGSAAMGPAASYPMIVRRSFPEPVT